MEAASVFSHTTFGALATINEDGSPWAVPLHIFHDNGAVYWLSAEETQHSQNILRDGRVSLTAWALKEGEAPRAIYVSGIATQLKASEMDDVKARMTAKLGSTPPIYDTTRAYRLVLGNINSSKSGKNRWYFYT
ncbi:MAG TPA: pyridoxamine 5'-phosphate oxidase family protein [Dongiaceae bacterium]|nr:pyridoxamine 5'-phosphate oxidase family protein [Dongiaceae bacterium]